jgi:hypothetical protein
MKGDGIPLTPPSVLYYRVRTFLPDYEEPVRVMIAVARASPIEQISAIISRA